MHVPFVYYPDNVGGTEVYVESLVQELNKFEVDGIIVAPGDKSESYLWNEIPIKRFSVSTQIKDVGEMYGEGDEIAAREFEKILGEEMPDIVHLHAYTRAISLKLISKIKEKKIPIVFTYHTPTITCQRGTMLRWGVRECDGVMNPTLCSACSLQGKGMSSILANCLAQIPRNIGKILGKRGLTGGIWTALRTKDLVSVRQECTRKFLGSMDHIVAVCFWVEQVLLANGLKKEKITLCRQGLAQKKHGLQEGLSSSKPNKAMRLAFLGRLDSTKGLDIVIKAINLIPECKLQLDIYGVPQGIAGAGYETLLRQLADNDKRIHFKQPIASQEVVKTLKNYDALVVPSQWMETGPLVVLEAFEAGIPVIGSKMGGIAELVQDGVNGFLVEPKDISQWAQVIKKMCETSIQRTKLGPINSPRKMNEVAEEMKKIYISTLKTEGGEIFSNLKAFMPSCKNGKSMLS